MTTLSWCAEQVRRYDYDRWITTLFAPPAEREAMSALYAFNVEVARVRETVTEPMLGRMRLQWWRDVLDAMYAGRPPHHPVAEPLAKAVDRYGLDRGQFERLLEARTFDLEDGAPQNLDALVRYAEGTSSSLTVLALEVLDGRGEPERSVGRDLGIAWALVGLVRAVPFQACSGRFPLPADLARDVGVEPAGGLGGSRASGLADVIARVAETAEQHLRSARSRRREVPKRVLPALLQGALADGHLRRLRGAGWDPYDRRVQEPGKAGRLARTALAALGGRY